MRESKVMLISQKTRKGVLPWVQAPNVIRLRSHHLCPKPGPATSPQKANYKSQLKGEAEKGDLFNVVTLGRETKGSREPPKSVFGVLQ